MLIVQRNTLLPPIVNPVTPLVGLFDVVTIPVPDCVVHKPVPMTAVFPDKVDVLTLHKAWSVLAWDSVGGVLTIIYTSSIDVPQLPFVIVHLNLVVPPIVKPVTPLLGSLASVTVPVPDCVAHKPVPVTAVLPANVVVVTLHKP